MRGGRAGGWAGGTLGGMGWFSRRGRWAVPAGALLVTGGVLAAAQMPAAQAAPSLPARTAAQLLAGVAGASVPDLSGTVVETAALGLPQLPGTADPTSIVSLLTGSHTLQVWFDGPQKYRVALPGSMSETDIYRNGSTAWLWQSAQNAVTQYTLPAHSAAQAPAGAGLPVTPQQAANDILAAVGPTTAVSVTSNVMVAGQAAYELVLTPKQAGSLVGQVRIAIDAANSVPLRVEVFARTQQPNDGASPAISIGFSSVTFAAPAAADLSFTPPPGAHVTQENLAAGQGPGWYAYAPEGGSSSEGVTGQGWLTVLKLPASLLNTALVNPGGPDDSTTAPVSISGGPGEDAAALQALLGTATQVSGSWGSGRLLHTSLLSVLISSNGTIYVGAVEPSILYAAAARTQ
jgi:Predicted periplasmic protein (DUF2092)